MEIKIAAITCCKARKELVPEVPVPGKEEQEPGQMTQEPMVLVLGEPVLGSRVQELAWMVLAQTMQAGMVPACEMMKRV
ncbi:hypothetical protein GGH12_005823 [Coemansia sp. RSA 1822]|nr:hypothetical protein LPJ76_006080 [Coemansia sp. RSA 638]KAJ2538754.1 hypothetical protein GGF49_005706 [Coemansia sp. RSA 1853]KAJ2558532.1 hypothetical protein GGH12_005823 [Coemansia sp. RSA 1822]